MDAVLFLAPGATAPSALEGTGPSVWAALRTPVSLDELTRELARQYDAEPQVVQADVERVVARLVELDVVEAQ